MNVLKIEAMIFTDQLSEVSIYLFYNSSVGQPLLRCEHLASVLWFAIKKMHLNHLKHSIDLILLQTLTNQMNIFNWIGFDQKCQWIGYDFSNFVRIECAPCV